MRKFMTMLFIVIAACFAHGGDYEQQVLSVTVGTNATESVTNHLYGIDGWIHEIKIDVVGVTTGNVAVVAVPIDSTFASITLASNTNLSSEAIFRPRFDGTDIGAVALTNDPPERFLCAGDAIRFTVTGTATGTTFKAAVKYIK